MLLLDPIATSFSFCATRFSPAYTTLLIPRADCAAPFSSLALAQVMLWNPFLLVSTSPGCDDSCFRFRDRRCLLLLGLGDEGEICDITEATQNCKNHRVCTQAEKIASVMPRTCRKGRDVQLEIEDGELRFHNHNYRFKSGYFFSFTVHDVFQPDVEFDITGSESVCES